MKKSSTSLSFTVLFEDNHLIAVKKISGDIIQSDKTGDITLAENVKLYIKKKYNKPGEVFLGIIHRIDRPVGGVVVFARTSKSLSRMNALFRDKEVKKEYWAIVEEKPPFEEGELTNWLKKIRKKTNQELMIKKLKRVRKPF